jgi:predicted dienelactone hydrolase
MIAAQPRLSGRIDAERVALAGHSFGTIGAQLVAGARSGSDELSDLADDRIDALVLFAAFASGAAGFGEGSWAGVRVPALAISGSEDPGPFGGDAVARLEPALRAASAGSMAFLLRGADHFVYLGTRGNSSPRLSTERRANARLLREERRRRMMLAKEGAEWTVGEMHFGALATLSRSFLDATLKGDGGARRWLDSEGPTEGFPGFIERVRALPAASE